ncbi:MAG: DNA mismatch repair protein MutS [Deltaproteobacteria bacterium]|nr:DNA mismatch repair protein MutS [Deltaproteobacteria bacterium]
MMQQYLAAKEKYPDALLLFRLGDFYELFFDDAKTAARVLGLTLTSRDKSEDPVPMAGVPHHAARGYIARLCDEGFKVAVCEQFEEPGKKGIFRREVSRVVTPGMVFDDESLEAKSENLLGALSVLGGVFGIAAIDVSTGRFRATQANDASLIADELLRLGPRELVVGAGVRDHAALDKAIARLKRARVVAAAADSSAADAGAAAASLCLQQLASALPSAPRHVGAPERYALDAIMLIDETSRKNLELTHTLIGGKREGSLLAHIDRTETGMGARLLHAWVTAPLLSRDAVLDRQGVVQAFCDRPSLRVELSRLLSSLYDLERLNGRLGALQATPRDLGSLRDSLALLPRIAAAVTQPGGELLTDALPTRLGALLAALGDFSAAERELAASLVDAAPVSFKEGGIFRRGFDKEIDELTALSESGKDYLLQMEARARERTKIPSLKIRYNRVFGYGIEITKSHLQRVPEGYIRKQTLANAERYVTEELQTYEEKVLHADERRLALEEARFLELRARLVELCPALKAAARAIAELDVLLSLATVASDDDWTRPEIGEGDDRTTELEAARHPVVEAFVRSSGERYVPCDVRLKDGEKLLVVTGPNMAGKSTVLRKVAVIQILAQIGSFVPCRRALIGVADRVFTRVGASDNLSQGQSTFMVEMSETAAILRGASERSLVIVDEIGRGTSTFDGLSLAWSVAEYLHDVVRCRGLFATHYHELIELERQCPNVKNFHMAVKEYKGEVVFLRELRAGGMSQSYGIEVGRLAGLPTKVLERAKELLSELERERRTSSPAQAPQMELFVPANPSINALEKRLKAIDLERMTPIDALNTLAELIALTKKRSQ